MSASKNKSEMGKSQKLLRFSKKALSKSLLKFYLVYYHFCLKRLRSK